MGVNIYYTRYRALSVGYLKGNGDFSLELETPYKYIIGVKIKYGILNRL